MRNEKTERGLNMKSSNFTTSHTKIEKAVIDSYETVRVVKNEKLDIFDENTYAILKDSDFHNGEIRVTMLSRLLPDAPDFARGFVGVVFRVNKEGNEFESYYVRPANGRHPDPIRRSHGSQYFSYPGYTFSYFREFNITAYEAPADIGLNEWIDLKCIIKDAKGSFYVNNQLVLEVNDLKHGPDARGAVGFYVDTGTEAFYRDLQITCYD